VNRRLAAIGGLRRSIRGSGGAVAAAEPPVLSSINTAWGVWDGGSSRVLTGAGFTGATVVSFCGVNAASFVVDSDTQITATTGAADPLTDDIGDIVVTTPGGTSTLSNGFTYTSIQYAARQISATCAVWDAGEGITLNGSDVSGWADQGDLATQLDVAQATAGNQPIYVSSGGPDGGPYITFTQSANEFMRKTTDDGQAAGVGAWVGSVLSLPTISAAAHMIVNAKEFGGTVDEGVNLKVSSGAKAQAVFYDSAARTATGATSLSTGTTYLLDGSIVGSNLAVFVNGTSDGTTACGATTGKACEVVWIGRASDGAASPLDALMSLSFIIFGNITTASALTVERYVEERFGLTIATRTI
jgi:hypothetical protein